MNKLPFWHRLPISPAAIGCVAMIVIVMSGGRLPGVEPPLAAPVCDTPDAEPEREIFVPFADLHLILSAGVERVFVTRAEYETLAAQARAAAKPTPATQPAAVLSADYQGTIEENRARLLGTLVVTAPDDALNVVELDLSGVALRSATLDGQAAVLGRNPAGVPVLFVRGAGRHELKLEILAVVETAAAQRTLTFQIPTPPATRLRLAVKGHVEIKSGATLVSREVDEKLQTTVFDLLPRRGQNSLVLSLNNRQLQKERVVVAHGVLIDEITSAYERLHATASMSVLHGATDQFRFLVPEGFEVTTVDAPQVARWAVSNDEGRRTLDVHLREATTDTVSLHISAIRSPARLEDWQFPKLAPLDVAGEWAVIGLLLENRLKPNDLKPQGLISIDAGVLAETLPNSARETQAGAPALTQAAAFYAPTGQYDLEASFLVPAAELRATTNVLLTLAEGKLLARGGFALVDVSDKLIEVDFSAPAGWQVTEVTPAGGAPLPLETYPADDGATRIHVRLPRSVGAGESQTIYFRAVSTPDGWLDDWQTQSVRFPVFGLSRATRDVGAIAVQTQDDMLARADQVERLTPLDANEKNKYGLENVETELAYRYDAPPYRLLLAISRVAPRITARACSFFRAEPDLLTAHYEIAYDVNEARTSRLVFELPASTPSELSIRGLDGVAIKESSSETAADWRRWTVLLGESRRGAIRLAIDFQQPLGGAASRQPTQGGAASDTSEPDELTLPLVRALDVAYQSGMVAVEGSAERDIQLITSLRKVDIGELADAEYQPGRRLLGTFGYGGDKAEIRLKIARPSEYELPTAIVERAELLTVVSAGGGSQTAARFQLRARALLVEVQLPPDSTLWSAYLDGQPTLPQRAAGSLLVELPATAAAGRRSLQLIYETPVHPLLAVGSLDLVAPKLLLPSTPGAAMREVPLADLVWKLATPTGLEIVRSSGSVFSHDIAIRESPLAAIGSAMSKGLSFSFGQNYARRAKLAKAAGKPSSGEEGDPAAGIAGAKEAAKSGRVTTESFDAETDGIEHFDLREPAVAGPASPLEMKGELGPPQASDPFGMAEEDADEKLDRPKSAFTVVKPQLAPPAKDEPPTGKPNGRQNLWALEGLRSLPIHLQSDWSRATFQSLGVEPRLSVLVVDQERLDLLGWALALSILLRGVWLTRRPARERWRFVVAVLAVAFALPLLLPYSGLLSPVCNMAFFAGCWLIVYYLAASVVRRLFGFAGGLPHAARHAAAALCVVLAMALGSSAEETNPPLVVPAGTIIVPYDPDRPAVLAGLESASGDSGLSADAAGGMGRAGDKSQKILVPYEKYLELLRSSGGKSTSRLAPPSEYAPAGAAFSVRLEGTDSLLIEGHLDVEVLVDRAVSVPLALGGGVLTKVKVIEVAGGFDNVPQPDRPGPIENGAAQHDTAAPAPADDSPRVIVSGPGRRRIELAMRFRLQRRGGWQIVAGRLPAPPAAALTLDVPKAGTEVALSGGIDRGTVETRADHETIDTALAADGTFHVQWRGKTGPAPVDQSLAARGAVLLDVQEDGLKLVWRFDLAFRGGQRDSFQLDIPEHYLVEKVSGGNVRGWRLSAADGRRRLEVTLLKPAQSSESFSATLSRRGSVSQGELAEFDAPLLTVADAAQQSGELTIRRSPLLELRTERAAGVSRIDGTAQPAGAELEAEESPLGILPYQAYRFATIPFTVRLSARPVTPRVFAELQTVLKISQRQRTLESRIRLRVDDRPIYRLRIVLPEDWKLDRVDAPQPFEWIVGTDDKRRLLNLYFAAGQRQPFDVVLAGTLGEYGPADTLALPKLEVADADEQPGAVEQTGDIVVEADPALNVRAEKLVHCETEGLARVNSWLAAGQQRLARLALRYRTPDYSAQLVLSPRKPIVHCNSFSNIRVTQRSVEETILLDFTIEEAGIRSLSFLLPASMRDARISAPMLRQKTVLPVDDRQSGRVRVQLELQEEVMNNLRVLIENDRLLTTENYAVPLPEIETGQTDHRYITLESAGRDEIVVARQAGVDPIDREQSEWQMLSAMLGRHLTQAYLVRPAAAEPLLALRAEDRQTVETAGARIGLAKATLTVDANGAFRGTQLYRVDNSLEQYLVIQMPAGARLWTAHVAGEPVKPAVDGAAGTLRIPLVKTAAGDADYPVVLKYGGQLKRLGAVDRVDFPLMRTVNIHVELSQVELYVPETYDWFDFDGTMRLVESEGDLAAGWLEYNTKQIGLALQSLRSSDSYERTRAINNLKVLQAESEALKQSAEAYRGNAQLAKQLESNTALQQGLGAEINASPQDSRQLDESDNRSRLNDLYRAQTNSRANEVASQSGENFEARDLNQAQTERKAGEGQMLNRSWLAKNKLENSPAEHPPGAKPTARRGSSSPANPSLQFGAPPLADQQAPAAQPAAPDAYFQLSEPALDSKSRNQPGQPLPAGEQAQRKLKRYADRLAQQQQTLEPRSESQLKDAPAVDAAGGGMGGMGGGAFGRTRGASPKPPGQSAAADTLNLPELGQAASQSVPPAALASLDVDFQPRGVRYLFTTPRGDVEVAARAVSGTLVGRLVWLSVLAIIGVVLLLVARRRRTNPRVAPVTMHG
jgi:hypothetical protein